MVLTYARRRAATATAAAAVAATGTERRGRPVDKDQKSKGTCSTTRMQRADLWWPACLALCLLLFSEHANASAKIQCPEKCSPQKTGVKSLATLYKEACVAATKFVFEVTLENMESTLSTDAYNMSILEAFIYGDDNAMGEERVFISRPSCKSGLSLQAGKNYLIMGQDSSIKKVAGKYHYVFDDNTWVQYWPTYDEGQTTTYKPQYDNLEQFRSDMNFGCKNRR
ncbi:hypothetical protein ACEWY4_017371 [Coilia grayii]|uniref:NTR domain-containing protein n=1 Tax=Coilia grayii TaxID=363190 RepID=A0ABD1JGP1_9TELE